MQTIPRAGMLVQRVFPAVIALLAGLLGQTRGEEAAATADFFDIVGETPAQIATALPEGTSLESLAVMLCGFVGLPMSAPHRREFIEGLRTAALAPKPQFWTRTCLLNLLEENERYDDALAIIRSGAGNNPLDSIREIGLLWKSGKQAEAAQAADRIVDTQSFVPFWLSLVQVDLIRNRTERAQRFLTFIEARSEFSPRIRHALALQHLELAQHQGEAARLIKETASPIMRAVWNAALGRKDEALADVRAAGSIQSIGDLELLLLALGPEPLLIEQSKAILATSRISPEQRCSLLLGFPKGRRFELWRGMQAGQAETVGVLELMLTDPFALALPAEARQAVPGILARHPGDARLQLFAALLNRNEPDHGKPYLLQAARAFRAGPAIADPSADPVHQALENSIFADPALSALEKLTELHLSAAPELQELLVGAPGFDKLPLEDQLRYLMAAQLDPSVVTTLAACKFDQVSQDSLGWQLYEYFSRRAETCTLPEAVLATLMERLPDIVCGSPTKEPAVIACQADSWMSFLGHQPVPEARLAETAKRLAAAAATRSPAVENAILSAWPAALRSLVGLDVVPRQQVSWTTRSNPVWWSALGIFAPADPACGESREDRPPTMLGSGMSSGDRQLRASAAQPILMTSPWALNVFNAMEQDEPGRQTLIALAAKLRFMLDNTPPRTVTFDLLVSSGILPCPDPAVHALAERRVATFATTPPDDPAIALSLFFLRLGDREPLAEDLAKLQGLRDYPLWTRLRLRPWIRLLRNRYWRDDAVCAALIQQLSFGEPAKPLDPCDPEPLDPFERVAAPAEPPDPSQKAPDP